MLIECFLKYQGNFKAVQNEKGLVSPKIPQVNRLGWDVFDAAVEVVINNVGKAKKGNAQLNDILHIKYMGLK